MKEHTQGALVPSTIYIYSADASNQSPAAALRIDKLGNCGSGHRLILSQPLLWDWSPHNAGITELKIERTPEGSNHADPS